MVAKRGIIMDRIGSDRRIERKRWHPLKTALCV